MAINYKIMWAWYDKINDEYRFIFQSKLQVKMCSMDYFKNDIKNNKGEIIQVEVKHHISNKDK